MDFLNVAAASSSDSNTKVLMLDGNTVKSRTVSGLSLGSIPDGDKGDITTSSSGATWTIDNAAVTYAKIQNVSATSRILGRKTASAGSTEECTLSEVLDFVGSAAQGDILYRGASSWTRLGAGTSGQYLKTQGTGANPVWDTVSASSGSRIYILTATGAGWSEEVANSSNPGTAAPLGGVGYDRFVIGFKPTNYRLSFWQYSVGDNNFGMRAQFSTSSDFSSPVNSDIVYASYDSSADVIRTGTGTLSLTGSAPYYMRFLYYNNSGSAKTVAIQNLSIELWN
jgi:hypothetical protein